MEKLTSKHFIFLIIAATGTSILNYPSLFIKIGGRDTWIFTIVASVILFLFAIYNFTIIRKTKSYDFTAVCYSSLGKTLGTIYLLLYSFTLILICVEASSVSSNAIHTNIFINNPVWYCLLLFILAAFFVSKNRFHSILSVTLLSMFIAIVIGIFIGVLNQRYSDFSTLRPILHDKDSKSYVIAAITQLGAMSSFAILLPIIRRIDDRNKLNKYTYTTLIFILAAMTISIINLIASLGPARSSNIFFPQFIQAQRISFGGFLENGEFFIIITSTLFWIVKYILAMFALYSIWENKISNKILFIGIVSAIVYGISWLISRNVYGLFQILYYYQYILIVVMLICPTLIYTIYGFAKNRNKTSNYKKNKNSKN